MLDAIMGVAVKRACEQLTDGDLATLNNVAQADFDPRGYPWYEKVAHLLTEKEGTWMHSATKDALSNVVLARLLPAAATEANR